jgi:hypothetical protein
MRERCDSLPAEIDIPLERIACLTARPYWALAEPSQSTESPRPLFAQEA